MDGAPPEITVVIVGWNSPVLKQALFSVVCQNYPNYEVFLLDDASDHQRQNVALAEQVLRKRFAGATTSTARVGKVALYKRTLPLIKPDRFVVNLDADDYFIRKDALSVIAACLEKDVWCVFGKHRDLNGHSCIRGKDYKAHIHRLVSGRRTAVPWFDHPHCAYSWLLSCIPDERLRAGGRYALSCTDRYLFAQAMELSGEDRIRCTGQFLYEYRYPTAHNLAATSPELYKIDWREFLKHPRLELLKARP